MVCIYCSSPTQVVNSRHQIRRNNIWRRRKCIACACIFTTYEGASLEELLIVESSGGNNITPLSRDKLFLSIYASCGHRKNSINDASALTETILNKIISETKNGRIAQNKIIDTTLEVLDKFDKAAATMYRAYHPRDPRG